MASFEYSKSLTACLAVLLCLYGGLASAMSGNEVPSYDDESRTPLTQLYAGLQIQNLIAHAAGNDEIGSFLPSPIREDSNLKEMTLSLISAIKQLTILEELEQNPIMATVIAVLHKVKEDGCLYLQDALNIQDDFNCTVSELISIQSRIELAQNIMATRKLVRAMLSGTSISVDNTCAFWNMRVLNNCTVSSNEISTVQNTLLTQIEMHTKNCKFCSIETE